MRTRADGRLRVRAQLSAGTRLVAAADNKEHVASVVHARLLRRGGGRQGRREGGGAQPVAENGRSRAATRAAHAKMQHTETRWAAGAVAKHARLSGHEACVTELYESNLSPRASTQPQLLKHTLSDQNRPTERARARRALLRPPTPPPSRAQLLHGLDGGDVAARRRHVSQQLQVVHGDARVVPARRDPLGVGGDGHRPHLLGARDFEEGRAHVLRRLLGVVDVDGAAARRVARDGEQPVALVHVDAPHRVGRRPEVLHRGARALEVELGHLAEGAEEQARAVRVERDAAHALVEALLSHRGAGRRRDHGHRALDTHLSRHCQVEPVGREGDLALRRPLWKLEQLLSRGAHGRAGPLPPHLEEFGRHCAPDGQFGAVL
eukprot:6209596-Pleurochrysis_carterae.AAC.3